MTYHDLIMQSHRFNQRTVYKFMEKNEMDERHRIIELLVLISRAKRMENYVGNINLLTEVLSSANNSSNYSYYKGHIGLTFEGRLTELLTVITTYVAHNGIDYNDGIETCSSLVEFCAMLNSEMYNCKISDAIVKCISELLSDKYSLVNGLRSVIVFICSIAHPHKIDLDKHVELFFKYGFQA